MSLLNKALRAREWGDDGFAMIVAMVISAIAIVLVTVILSMSVHLDQASTRERKWQLALQVAEAGVERAVSLANSNIQANGSLTFGGEAGPVTVAGGQFQTRVTPIAAGGLQIDAVGYVPSATASPDQVKRRLRVQFTPAPSFKYALYSATDLFVKSSGGVSGDVFANQRLEVYNGTIVTGSAISATGVVVLDQGAEIHKAADGSGGNVYSGGTADDAGINPDKYGIYMQGNSLIQGDAHAQVDATPCSSPDLQHYVWGLNGSQVNGTVFTPSGTRGTLTAGATTIDCEGRFASTSIPSYSYNPANYSNITQLTAAQFNALPSHTHLVGTYRVVAGASDSVDLACRTIDGNGGNFALITEAHIIDSNSCNDFIYTGPTNSSPVVQIISLNNGDATNPAVDIQNQFDITASGAQIPAVLIYAVGYCSLKNNVVTNGAVYCGAGVNIVNSLNVTYDAAIQSLVGFGNALYQRTSFRELTSTTPYTQTT